MNKAIVLAATLLMAVACTEKPFEGALPSPYQIAWQDMEMTMFCHFGPNTFTGLEWGEGTEAEDLFNPTDLDCRQWARVCKQAGMKGQAPRWFLPVAQPGFQAHRARKLLAEW